MSWETAWGRIRKHSLIKRALEETITMKEVRDHLLGFLEQHKTLELCANCPEHAKRAPDNKTYCCAGCPLHSVETGCTLRNTACLSWCCVSLQEYLQAIDEGVYEEYRVLQGLFSGLDTLRGYERYPDDVEVRVLYRKKNSGWTIGTPYAEVIPEHRDRKERILGWGNQGLQQIA